MLFPWEFFITHHEFSVQLRVPFNVLVLTIQQMKMEKQTIEQVSPEMSEMISIMEDHSKTFRKQPVF